jgi:hypothetical protein
MAQDLTVNIKTTSDVPQAMDKAKSATVSFGKQVDDIGKKFSMAFKDIAFAFVAPLVLLNSAISAISDAIAKAKEDTKDVLDFASKGTSVFADKGATDMARAAERTNATSKEKKLSKKQREVAAQALLDAGDEQGVFGDSEGNLALKQYLDEGEGKGALEMARRRAKHALMFTGVNSIAGDAEMQDVLSRRAALSNDRAAMFSDNPNDPAAAAAAQAAAQKASDDAAKAKGTTFKGPEGLSNVVGVGANPVIEAMTMQLEETRKQTVLLEAIARPATGGGVPVDFTKATTASPSRAAMLTGK